MSKSRMMNLEGGIFLWDEPDTIRLLAPHGEENGVIIVLAGAREGEGHQLFFGLSPNQTLELHRALGDLLPRMLSEVAAGRGGKVTVVRTMEKME